MALTTAPTALATAGCYGWSDCFAPWWWWWRSSSFFFQSVCVSLPSFGAIK